MPYIKPYTEGAVPSLRSVMNARGTFQGKTTGLAALTLIHNKATGDVVGFRRTGGEVGIICGRVEEGESADAAAIREIKEEAGLTLTFDDLKYVVGMIAPSNKTFVQCYYAEIDEPVNPNVNVGMAFSEEGYPFWCKPEQLTGSQAGVYDSFNTTLLHFLSDALNRESVTNQEKESPFEADIFTPTRVTQLLKINELFGGRKLSANMIYKLAKVYCIERKWEPFTEDELLGLVKFQTEVV